jgi:hypothetical protein
VRVSAHGARLVSASSLALVRHCLRCGNRRGGAWMAFSHFAQVGPDWSFLLGETISATAFGFLLFAAERRDDQQDEKPLDDLWA